MSAEADFEPIEPGGGSSDAVSRWVGEALRMMLALALIYLGLTWWQGETPGWKAVVSAAGALGWLITSLVSDKPPNRSHVKKLRRLFAAGRIPDPDKVMGILSGTAQSDFLLLTERHTLGFLTREEWAHQMSVLLKLPPP